MRDRSNDPGCEGRVRITIGTREQMSSAVVALNETLASTTERGGAMTANKTSTECFNAVTTQRSDRSQDDGNPHRHQAHH